MRDSGVRTWRLALLAGGAAVVAPLLLLVVGGAEGAGLRPAAESVAEAQIPTTFSNLQVIPSDLPQAALVGIMRNIAGSLGVRCDHCHVGEDAATLEGFDFASDDKETKVVARAMLRMVEQINGTLLPATGRDPAALTEVTCFTCHHGAERPDTLRNVLTAELAANGVEATIVRYQELREQYYGRAVYDFGRTALSSLAENAVRSGNDFATAIRLLAYNIEMYPEWDYHYFLLGQAHFAAGNRAAAIASLRKALELRPDSTWYRDTLAEMESQQD